MEIHGQRRGWPSPMAGTSRGNVLARTGDDRAAASGMMAEVNVKASLRWRWTGSGDSGPTTPGVKARAWCRIDSYVNLKFWGGFSRTISEFFKSSRNGFFPNRRIYIIKGGMWLAG